VQEGCAPKQRIRVDLDKLTSSPDSFKQYEVIITANIEDVLKQYDKYMDKHIEVTAPFNYYGDKRFWTWYVLLNDNGKVLRCFTDYYRLYAGWDAELLLESARHNKAAITVNGILRKDGLEIKEIIYNMQVVRPDLKSIIFRPYFVPGYYY
jgi:hypothetical protein